MILWRGRVTTVVKTVDEENKRLKQLVADLA